MSCAVSAASSYALLSNAALDLRVRVCSISGGLGCARKFAQAWGTALTLLQVANALL